MFKTKQFGALLIIVGIFIPSILYPFTTVESNTLLFQLNVARNGGSFEPRLHSLEIILNKGGAGKDNRLTIPYKYPLALGILLSFTGSCLVVLCKNKKESD